MASSKYMNYDKRQVVLHYSGNPPVLLINEAPAQQETISGIPLYGQQGGNLYRHLKFAEIGWALEFQPFTWTTKDYTTTSKIPFNDISLKMQFLELRKHKIACTNAYNYWPKPDENSEKFIPPEYSDVNSAKNLKRLINEIQAVKPKVLLICGRYSYLACVGQKIIKPSKIEGTLLNPEITQTVKQRMCYNFDEVWYMGHTRRWSLNKEIIQKALNQIAIQVNWK